MGIQMGNYNISRKYLFKGHEDQRMSAQGGPCTTSTAGQSIGLGLRR